jgi:hypothetical protein
MSSNSDLEIQAWLDQEDEHTAQIIRAHGVYLQYVGGDDRHREASFAYTVGLFGVGHPELLIVGVGPNTASGVLNDVSAKIRAGRNIVAGEMLSFADWPHRVVAEVVPNPGEIAFAANRFYQRPVEASVPLLQLTYDDKNGRFPWEDGYANAPWVQPRPGELRA